MLALPAMLVLASMRFDLKRVFGMAWKALLSFAWRMNDGVDVRSVYFKSS